MPLFLTLLGVMLLISTMMTVRRAFATDRFLADPVTGEADEQGVRIDSAHGHSDLTWAPIHNVVVTSNLVTIYQSARTISNSSSGVRRGRRVVVRVPPARCGREAIRS